MLISYYRYVLSSNEIWFIVLLYIIIAYLYQNKDNAIFPIQTVYVLFFIVTITKWIDFVIWYFRIFLRSYFSTFLRVFFNFNKYYRIHFELYTYNRDIWTYWNIILKSQVCIQLFFCIHDTTFILDFYTNRCKVFLSLIWQRYKWSYLKRSSRNEEIQRR